MPNDALALKYRSLIFKVNENAWLIIASDFAWDFYWTDANFCITQDTSSNPDEIRVKNVRSEDSAIDRIFEKLLSFWYRGNEVKYTGRFRSEYNQLNSSVLGWFTLGFHES